MSTDAGPNSALSPVGESSQDRTNAVIESVSDLPRLRALEDLQTLIWGNDNGTIVPAHLLQLVASTGGIVLGAFRHGQAVGFAFGLLAQHRGRLYHASHMLGVHPACQEAGIGAALKYRQREQALNRGLDVMTWTFDPLEARNAHFNLHKLGAAGRAYREDYYGAMDDVLNRGLPSDRMHIEWRLRPVSPSSTRSTVPADAVSILVSRPEGPALELPSERPPGPIRIATPVNVQRLKRENMALATAWRSAQREAFRWAFAHGYMASDFVDGAFHLVPDDGLGL